MSDPFESGIPTAVRAFTAGFVSRHDAAAAALVSAFPVEGAAAPFVARKPGGGR